MGKCNEGREQRACDLVQFSMLLSVLGQWDIKTSLVCPAIWVFPDIPTEPLYCPCALHTPACFLRNSALHPSPSLLSDLSLLQDLASDLLAAGLNHLTRRLRMAPQSSCGRLCPLVLAVSPGTLFHYIRFTHTGF